MVISQDMDVKGLVISMICNYLDVVFKCINVYAPSGSCQKSGDSRMESKSFISLRNALKLKEVWLLDNKHTEFTY